MKNFTYCCDSCLDFFNFSEDDNVFICPICKCTLTYCETEEIDPTSGKIINKYQESARKNANPDTHKRVVPITSTPTVTCPYCQSTDTKKISGTSRWVSTGLFGLASSKVGKQWHCRKCKSDF